MVDGYLITYEKYLNGQYLGWRCILTVGIIGIALGKEGGRGGGFKVSCNLHQPRKPRRSERVNEPAKERPVTPRYLIEGRANLG